MKTKSYLAAALAVSLAVPVSAFAVRQSDRPSAASQAHGAAAAPQAEGQTPMAWRVARYPFLVGYSVIKTPLIVGETFTGKRTFISNRGLFQENETPQADQRNSQPQGRGERNLR